MPPRFRWALASGVPRTLAAVEVFERAEAPHLLERGFVVEDFGATAVGPGGDAAQGVRGVEGGVWGPGGREEVGRDLVGRIGVDLCITFVGGHVVFGILVRMRGVESVVRF